MADLLIGYWSANPLIISDRRGTNDQYIRTSNAPADSVADAVTYVALAGRKVSSIQVTMSNNSSGVNGTVTFHLYRVDTDALVANLGSITTDQDARKVYIQPASFNLTEGVEYYMAVGVSDANWIPDATSQGGSSTGMHQISGVVPNPFAPIANWWAACAAFTVTESAGIAGPPTATDDANTTITGASLSLTELPLIRATNGATTTTCALPVTGPRTAESIPVNVQLGAAAVIAGAVTQAGCPPSVGGWSLEWVVPIDGGGEYTLPVAISAQSGYLELLADEALKSLDNSFLENITLGDDDAFIGPNVIVSTNVTYLKAGDAASGYFTGDTEGGAAIDSTTSSAIYHESTEQWKRLDTQVTTVIGAGAFGEEFEPEFQ